MKAHSIISPQYVLRFEPKRFLLGVKLSQSKVTLAKIAIFKTQNGRGQGVVKIRDLNILN